MGEENFTCDKRPTTLDEFEVCQQKDIEEYGVPGLRKMHGWIALTRDQIKDELVRKVMTARARHLWNSKATQWCLKDGKKVERLNDKISSIGDQTCAIFDMDGETLKNFCLEEHRLNPGRSATPQCTEGSLGTAAYQEVNVKYCNKHPEERWCSCHNLVNKRCGDSPDGAGCRKATLDPKLADDAILGQSSYDKLNTLNHCRREMCTATGMFIPSNRPECPEKFTACEKEFNLRTVKNSDIIRHCVLGSGGSEEDLEELLSGEVADLDEAMKLQSILTAEDEDALDRKRSRLRNDVLIVMSILICCISMAFMLTRRN